MLKIALAQKGMIIEEVVRRELMTYEHDCEVTETDQMMINRLVSKQELTGQQIVDEVLKYHRR